jgi:hypothetical protein
LAGFKRDFNEVAGSMAIKNKPTGLFAMGIFSISDSNDSNVEGAFNGQDAPTMRAWNVQGGIQRRVGFLSLDKFGETSFWGGYSEVRNGFAPGSNPFKSGAPVLCTPNDPSNCGAGTLGAIGPDMTLPANSFPSIGFKTQVTGSDVNDWFLALDQSFEAAAFHLYAVYQHFDSPTLNLIGCESGAESCLRNHVPLKLDGFDLGYVGGRIYF